MTNAVPDIRYLDRKEIDTEKWDRCIAEAGNSLIYARSFYLDTMAENWSALVEGDYQQVMPLTWNKKFGFSYLYQPYFTKTLGVFGTNTTPFDISFFLLSIPEKFKYWDIDLNENNYIANGNLNLKPAQYDRTNYLLNLEKKYDELKQQYKRLAKRMKKKALENQVDMVSGEDPSALIEFYRKDYQDKHRSIPASVYDRLKICVDFAFKNKMAETLTARSASGEILAYYIVLADEKYLYSLLGGSTAKGKKMGAFYLLTDAVIQAHAESKKIFRFEGSDIPGISFFDSLFGPKKISYPHLTLNKLPFPFRFFK